MVALKLSTEKEQTAPDDLISYDDAIKYWSSIEPSINGVLGGYGDTTNVPRVDIVGSLIFYRRVNTKFLKTSKETKYGMDFGAGIGRVTKNLLSNICDQVDLLEPVENFVVKMNEELRVLKAQGKIGEILQISMQNWVPKKTYKYHLLWCQCCCGHLTDDDFLKWMDNCRLALKEGGILIIKENNSTDLHGNDIFDPTDFSKTRSDLHFKKLFKQAGWNLCLTMKQRGMPRELYPIQMYALQPDKNA